MYVWERSMIINHLPCKSTWGPSHISECGDCFHSCWGWKCRDQKCRQGRVRYGLIKPGTRFCFQEIHVLTITSSTWAWPKAILSKKTSRYVLKRLMVAFGNHGNKWRVSVINGCWNLKMKKRAEVDRLASQSLGGARFGASHLLLPVIVCCANIASLWWLFHVFPISSLMKLSFLWRHNSTIIKGYHTSCRCDYLEKA